MKKNVIKTAIAAVCVVAAGVSGMKAYNVANQSEADLLLAENVEALSAGEWDPWDAFEKIACPWQGYPYGCCVDVYWNGEIKHLHRDGYYLDSSRLPW